jgi:hypothetical protein
VDEEPVDKEPVDEVRLGDEPVVSEPDGGRVRLVMIVRPSSGIRWAPPSIESAQT